MPRNLHRIAHQTIPTRMLHGSLELSVELYDVYGESGSFADGAVFVGGGLYLDGVEGDEGRLA